MEPVTLQNDCVYHHMYIIQQTWSPASDNAVYMAQSHCLQSCSCNDKMVPDVPSLCHVPLVVLWGEGFIWFDSALINLSQCTFISGQII